MAQCWLRGWYKGVMGLTKARNNYGDQTAFTMEIMVRYTDGTTESIYTNNSWTGCDSPIVFSEIYDGEMMNAALEIADWAQGRYSFWKTGNQCSRYFLIHR